MKNHLKVLCGVMAMALGGQVFATTWNLVGAPQDYPTAGVTISAYANTGGDNTGASKVAADSQTIQSADWMGQTWDNGYYGGVKNSDACASQPSGSNCDLGEGAYPEHAIDNSERYEMVLLTFSEMVNLTDVRLNFRNIDSDITVMAFQGTSGQKLIDKTWSTLDSGWKLIGHYSDVATDSARSLNSGAVGGLGGSAGIYSSFWLIGAYNPLVGANQSWSLGNDHVKLTSVIGNACPPGTPACSPPPSGKVPEPGSLALLGLGLLGMMRLRRFRQT